MQNKTNIDDYVRAWDFHKIILTIVWSNIQAHYSTIISSAPLFTFDTWAVTKEIQISASRKTTVDFFWLKLIRKEHSNPYFHYGWNYKN